MADPSPRKPLVARLALALATFALLFAVGELTARVLVWRAFAAVPPPPTSPDGRELPVLRGTRALARANVEGVHKGVYYRTNSLGFRGPDVAPSPTDGVLRVVVTGDSVAMGDGVREEDTYARQVAPRIGDDGEVEVVNAAMSGAEIEHAMTRLDAAVEAYAPHVVVYGFTVNDVEGEGYRETDASIKAAARAARRGPFPESPSVLLRYLSGRIGALGAASSPGETWYAREVLDNYGENPAVARRLRAGLARFAAHARALDGCGVVMIHTHLNALGGDHAFIGVYEQVAEAARDEGLPVVVSFPAFRGRDAQALWVSPFDPHPNAEGHALLAGVLAEGLRGLPAHCLVR